MLDAEKQLTRINSNIMFMVEKSFGLLFSFKILVLAIIIIAAIQILNKIKIADIRSIPENHDIDINVYDDIFNIIETGATIIRVEEMIHQ